MNDLEAALRDVLRARAEAAERPVSLLDGLRRRARRSMVRRRVATSAVAAVAVAVAVAVPVALRAGTRSAMPSGSAQVSPMLPKSPAPSPAIREPLGWVPVTYGDVQISVPRKWLLLGGTRGCGGRAPGAVFVGMPLKSAMSGKEVCASTPNVVQLISDPHAGSMSFPPHAAVTINGIAGLRGEVAGGVWFVALPLEMEIVATGPRALQVIATVTRSPLAFVLGTGPATPVPAGWRWHKFGGIRFAVPARWTVSRRTWWETCPQPINPDTVQLSTAKTAPSVPCPTQSDLAGQAVALPGVVVGAGPAAPGVPGRNVSCATRRGTRICVLPPPGTSSVLTVWVRPPGIRKSIVVQIGLAGTGHTARAIFDSIRPAAGS